MQNPALQNPASPRDAAGGARSRVDAAARLGLLTAGLVAAVAARRAVDPWPGATSVAAAAVFVLLVAGLVALDSRLSAARPRNSSRRVSATRSGSAAADALGPIDDGAADTPPQACRSPRRNGRRPQYPGSTLAPGGSGLASVGFGLLAAAALSLGPLVEHLRDPGGALPLHRLPVWALAVVAVAVAQEVLLRGRLWDAVTALLEHRERAAAPVALLVTTVVFAVIHVPFYGWHVLGVDLAAGLVLGGLRLATGNLLAPITAHVAADLAGWWLP